MGPRLYLLGERAVRRLLPAAHAAWSGLWLGLLDRGALHRIDAAMYDGRAVYHRAEHNRRGLFPWEHEAIEGYFGGRGRVLVLAAGAGREVLALWRRGFAVEGFECNPSLVAAAAHFLPGEGCPHGVRAAPRDGVPPDAHPCDAVVVGWSAYSLTAGGEDRIALLRGLRALIPEGGPLLLSFFTRAADDRRAGRVARVARRVRRLRGALPREPGDDMLPNFVHRFTRDEVEAEMRAGGFRMVRWQPQGPGPYDSGWAVGVAAGTD